jgi:hypothetical protein
MERKGGIFSPPPERATEILQQVDTPVRGGGQYRGFPLKEICFSAESTFSTTAFGNGA